MIGHVVLLVFKGGRLADCDRCATRLHARASNFAKMTQAWPAEIWSVKSLAALLVQNLQAGNFTRPELRGD